MSGKALAGLGRIGRFRHTPYPSVLIGTIESPDGSVEGRTAVAGSSVALSEWYARAPDLFEHVNRATPIDATTQFERDDVTEALCVELEKHASRLCGGRFYVRVNLRGLKGRVEAQACERALGSFLWEQSAKHGAAAEVAFEDTDIVVAVEVIGKRAGFAFLDRRMRSIDLIRPR